MTEPTSHKTTLSNDERFRVRSRALGDPTRYGIYREIARREQTVSVAELVEQFGFNHNTVRQHLAKLRDAGLIEDVPDAPHGPGRPRIRYRLTAQAAADWNDEGPYERLSLLLLEVATTGASALDVGRAAGRNMALDLAAGEDPIAAMTRAMTAQGFAPRVTVEGEQTELALDHCPFAAAAEANPEVVCSLHRGMLEGLASQVDGVQISDLISVDPRRASCLVHLERPSRR